VSNPLIRPNDPRFQRPPLRDAAGNNVFGDPDAPVQAEPADGQPLPGRPVPEQTDNLFAAPAADTGSQPAYQPQFETTQRHRGVLLLVLAVVGLAGSGGLGLVMAGVFWGLIGLVGIVPAMAAWLLALADVKAMRSGAMDPSGLGQTRLALWLGAGGLAIYVGVLVAVVLIILTVSLA
jgi:hypothetical protein